MYMASFVIVLQRAELLQDLSKVQVNADELALFDSIAHLGTKNSRITSLSKRPATGELQVALQNPNTALAFGLKGWTGRKKRRKLERV